MPVMLTYDSATICGHTAVNSGFEAAIEAEIRKHYETFCGKLKVGIRIHLILVPLGSKGALLDAFDMKLKALQAV